MIENMKNLVKYFSIVLVAGGFFSACETTELNQLVSPNQLGADQADPNLVLNAIQLAYATNQSVFSDRGAELTRIDYMFGRDYFNNYNSATMNGVWSRTYSSGGNGPGAGVGVGMLTNLQALEGIDANSDTDYSFHIGVTKALLGHSLMQLTDYVGQATWSEAGNPTDFPAPLMDDGQSVYNSAFELLDEAQSLLAGSPNTQGATDLYYGGDSSKWIKFINTVRLRAYVVTNNKSAFDAIIASGNFIATKDDDFEFQYGANELNPDTRHPDYAADYTSSGANIYQSNWLMETMLDLGDPRIRYYFYRQVDATPGADADPNEETISCSLVVPPPHYVAGGHTYCSVPNGYWGRSHGNDEGTPPDNFLRAAVGAYPTAGRFDDDSFGNVGLGEGGGGAGIEPIILSSYVDFWRGIMAASAAEKSGHLRTGLVKSIAKVQEFGAKDSGADLSLEPSPADVTTYIDAQVAAFDAATGDDQENIFAEQYFITLYGGATESYNYYRLTGFPTTVAPNWQVDPGPFPRTFLLPQNEVITNPNLTQRTDLTTQVFWDTNPSSPTFPPAN